MPNTASDDLNSCAAWIRHALFTLSGTAGQPNFAVTCTEGRPEPQIGNAERPVSTMRIPVYGWIGHCTAALVGVRM